MPTSADESSIAMAAHEQISSSGQIEERRIMAEPTDGEEMGMLEVYGVNSNDFDSTMFFGDTLSTEVPMNVTIEEGAATDESVAAETEDSKDVVIEELAAENEPTPEVNDEFIEEVASEIDTTSYVCSTDGSVANGDEPCSPQTEHVVQFDYDLTLGAGADLDSELVNLQNTLLSYVGSELIASGCSFGVLNEAGQGLVVDELSSLPEDTLNERGES
jgi:hypothetical protein